MKFLKNLLLFTLCIGLTNTAFSQGETCATAAAITEGTGIVADGPASGGGATNADATDADWYAYTATATGTIQVDACGGGADTRLYVYDGTCGALNLVANNDDACALNPDGSGSAFASGIAGIPVVNGTTYYIEWDSRWSSASFTWNLAFTPPPPAGDVCDSALVITNTGLQIADGPSAGAGATNADGNATNADWYQVVLPANGTISLNSCNQGVDTRVHVYDGSCGALNLIASNDDACDLDNDPATNNSWASELVDVPVIGGVTYYIEWDDRWSTAGFEWMFEYTADQTPAGNTCDSALAVGTGIHVANGPAAGNGATNDDGNADHANWYSFTSATAGVLEVASCGGGVDTRLHVYEGSCGALTLIETNDDDCALNADGTGSAFASRVSNIQVQPGVTYYIEWDNRWSTAGFLWSLDFVENIITEDAGITAIGLMSRYTIIPVSQVQPFFLAAQVASLGTNTIHDVTVEMNVYNEIGELVYTETPATIDSIVSGGSEIFFGVTDAYTPTLAGTYVAEYITQMSDVDGNISNDTVFTSVLIDETYARDDLSTFVGGIGLPDGNEGHIGQTFEIVNDGELESVTFFLSGPAEGSNTRIEVMGLDADGVPDLNNIIATSDNYVITADDAAGAFITLDVQGGSLTLAPGNYFFGVYQETNNLSIGRTSSIYTQGTGFINWPSNGGWGTNEDYGQNVSYILRPNFSNEDVCGPAALTTSSTDEDCLNGVLGTASVDILGGTAPYTYMWSDNQTTATATDLTAGTYTVVVTDTLGCEYTETVTVGGSGGATLATTATQEGCTGSADGSATVTATGVGPFSYLWSNGANTATTTNLTSGNYTVLVTDANGCNSSAAVVITSAATITASITASTDVSCAGGNDGTATVEVDGEPGYSYQWNDANAQTSAEAIGLAAGTYTVMVHDINGCQTSTTVTINEPADAVTIATIDSENESELGANDGMLEANAMGGTMPYTYEWTQTLGNATYSGATVSGVIPGDYVLTVTDANGCTTTATTTVNSGVTSTITIEGVSNFSIAPNPTVGNVAIDLTLANASDVRLDVFNGVGQIIETINTENVTTETYNVDLTNKANGIYFVRITIGNETMTRRIVKK